jgi:hypothetical protein
MAKIRIFFPLLSQNMAIKNSCFGGGSQPEVVDALNDTEAQRYELAMPVAGLKTRW